MKGLAGRAIWLSAGRIVASALQALVLVVVARSTPPNDFGIVVVVISFLAIPQVLFDFGISTYSLRERALRPRGGRLSYALQVGTNLAFLLSIILLVSLLALGILFNPLFFKLIPLAAWAAAERNADLWLGLLIADGDTRANVLILIIRRALAFGLTCLGLWLALDSVIVFTTSLAVSALVGAAWARRVIGPTLGRPTRVGLARLRRRTGHFWANSLAAQARNVDGIIVSAICGPIEAGFYSLSTRLINPLKIVPDSLAGILLPASSGENYQARGSRRLIVMIVASLVALLGLVACAVPFVVPLLLGSDYVQAIPAMQMIVVGLVFSSVSSIYGALLMGRGYVRLVARVATLTTFICLAGVTLGSLIDASFGAATGAAMAFAGQCCLLLGASRGRNVV